MLGTIIIISIAILLIGFNLYIRVSTLKYIKTMMDKGIRFGWEQLISSQRWQKEVVENYPNDADFLNRFRKQVLSTSLLFILVIIIVLVLLFSWRSIYL
ncbi:MAG: hypothetical protein IPI99_10335 [Saprospiraceae bacterium]|jgi:hypothetical protein|nr:hypothetical protein [Saprospiraceae bacterium]